MKIRIFNLFFVCMLMIKGSSALAQSPLPFTIANNSTFSDASIYVAIVGEDLTGPPGAHMWVDCKTSAVFPMSPSYNTVQGPVYGGNMGPGGNAMYANCFTRLSEIPNKTVMLPPIQGCRVYIAQGQQLYFYFFGATGSPRGYTAPSHTDPTDPNQGIMYEMIELTYNQFGFFGNPSRVDSYKFPMGLELFGGGGYYKKVGEIKTHTEIGNLFKANVPTEFQGCYKASTGEIIAPAKTPEFADGSVGSMPTPGPYVNYMKPYVDQVWTKYMGEDLIFDSGDAGIWRGRVQGEQLVMTAQTGGFTGRRGIIVRRPTTQETFEGKGVLDNVVQDATTDLLVQAQICAALNRRVINVTTPNVGQQNWSQSSTYYSAAPCNFYARFWHLPGISVDQLSYGFAYDDVWNYSPSLHSPTPTKVVATFGGFAGSVGNTPPTVSITSPTNGATFTAPANITINATASDANGSVTKVEFFNGTTKLGEDLTSPYTFSWTNVASGTYSLRAIATDNGAATTTSSTVSITVGTGGGLPAPWQTTDVGAVAASGSASHNTGTFTVQGSGADIWGTADEFRYVYQALSGNGSITARVTSLTNTNGWAKAGVMIRESLSASSTHASTVITPVNGISFQRRTATGGTSTSTGVAGQAVPKYLRITRSGTTFTSSYSTDGTTFTTIGSITITMANTVQIGMGVTSHSDGVLTTATFTNVTVSGGATNIPPAVSIASPSNGASFTAPASITINANASDSDGSVSRVEFFNGSTKLGEDLTSPYSFTWSNVAAGSYNLTARASDNAGATTNSSAVSVTVSGGPTGNWQLVWADEFTNGIGPDWTFETGTGNGGWGNNELQYYLPQNATVANGQLVITAKRESVGGMQYTSARMKTQGRKSWKYGRIEARIATPSFQGVWPAFWMLGDNFPTVGWPGCGEIDILEHVNTGNQVFGAIHWIDHNNTNANYTGSTTAGSAITNFHIYHIEWSPGSIKWFADGVQFHEANILNSINGTNEFHNNFFVILNMAIGGNWPGFTIDNTAFPASMYVDYVRVYQEGTTSNIPPTVSITSPSNNATFTAPASITINASASDPDGTISKVDFFSGGSLVGTDATSPYSFTMTNVSAGTYSLTARATDNGGATTTSSAVSVTVTGGTGLPSPWQTADVGAVAATGSATHSNGTFTVQGSGADIWGTADEFRYVYQTLNGNGSIVARVTSLTNTNAWAKSGVMIRETLAANSKHAATVITPTSGVTFPRRTETGATSTSTTIAGQTVPKYLKIERNGSTFISSYSSDGVNFTTVNTISISMVTNVYIGLCLSSHNDGVLASSTFTNVSFTGGSGGGGTGVCTGTVPNGDYSYEVSTSGSTVNWKFIPLAPIAGSTLSIININGTGFQMTPSGSNFIYSSNAYSSAQSLTFYFTYRVGNTATERNSSATPHSYTVGATCAGSASARSSDTGIIFTDETFAEDLQVYPNPVSTELRLRNAEKATLKILNAQGIEVGSRIINATTVDISELPPGVYNLVMIIDNRMEVRRFVKK